MNINIYIKYWTIEIVICQMFTIRMKFLFADGQDQFQFNLKVKIHFRL